MKTVGLPILHYWLAPKDVATITLLLTALIVAVHFFSSAFGWAEALRDALGLQRAKLHTYLTYAVLHDHEDIYHLLENVFLLMALGPCVERMADKKLYVLVAIGLCVLGAMAAAVLAKEYLESRGDLVGLSAFTYALIPAASYRGALKIIGCLSQTVWAYPIAVTVSLGAFAALVYHESQSPEGASLVVHIVGPAVGTGIAFGHALHRPRKLNQSSSSR